MRSSALFVLALSVAFLYETAQLDPGARRVPLAVAVPLVVLSLALVVHAFRRSPRLANPGAAGGDTTARTSASPIRAMLWVASLPIAVFVLGLQVGAPLFVLLFLRVQGREQWSVALLGTAVAAGVIAVLFRVLLDTSIPAGLLLSLVAGDPHYS